MQSLDILGISPLRSHVVEVFLIAQVLLNVAEGIAINEMDIHLLYVASDSLLHANLLAELRGEFLSSLKHSVESFLFVLDNVVVKESQKVLCQVS